jgi:hypothetical protein
MHGERAFMAVDRAVKCGWSPNVECDICCGAPWLYEPDDDTQAYRCPNCYPAALGDPVLRRDPSAA